jgi:hypothetical protein
LGSSEQIDYFKSLKPDLAILPELKFKNIEQLNPRSCSWITNNHTNASPKGLGVLGFGETVISELQRDVDMELFLPLRISTPALSFNLVAVWNFYHACKQGRFRGIRGDGALEWAAINHYASVLESPCMIGGDWNFGPTFSRPAFLRMCELFKSFGFDSLYHSHYSLTHDRSDHPTFKSPTGHLHHLDHLFATRDLAARIKSYEVCGIGNAVRSDHSAIRLFLDCETNK